MNVIQVLMFLRYFAYRLHGEMRNTYTILVGKPDGMKVLGRSTIK
jgi:hypothetical protein